MASCSNLIGITTINNLRSYQKVVFLKKTSRLLDFLAMLGLLVDVERAVIMIPILIKRFVNTDVMDFLAIKHGSDGGLLGNFPIEAHVSQKDWSIIDAHQHVVTETILSLQNFHINRVNCKRLGPCCMGFLLG